MAGAHHARTHEQGSLERVAGPAQGDGAIARVEEQEGAGLELGEGPARGIEKAGARTAAGDEAGRQPDRSQCFEQGDQPLLALGNPARPLLQRHHLLMLTPISLDARKPQRRMRGYELGELKCRFGRRTTGPPAPSIKLHDHRQPDRAQAGHGFGEARNIGRMVGHHRDVSTLLQEPHEPGQHVGADQRRGDEDAGDAALRHRLGLADGGTAGTQRPSLDE